MQRKSTKNRRCATSIRRNALYRWRWLSSMPAFELGQSLFIGAVFVLLWLMELLVNPTVGARNPWQQAERLSVSAAYVVGTVAMFWVFDRTYSFLR